MNSIAVFIKNYSIGKSAPVLCMLDLLTARFDAVDVYAQDVWCTSAAVLNRENIRLVILTDCQPGLVGKIRRLIKPPNNKKFILNKEYDYYLCFDPHGFMLCRELFSDASPVYYSLELYFRNNHFNLQYPRDVIRRERAWINSIKGLIIQSEERAKLFRQEYNLSSTIPVYYLPVTYLQPSVRAKKNVIREKYSLGSETRIALHLGGIQGQHSCIEVAMAFANLDGWALVFHGYYYGEYIDRLRAVLSSKQVTNVFISDEVYEFMEDMDPLVMSCDLGIAWYNDVSPNFTTAGKSSGKISAYLRFGLPVIAKKYPSTLEALELTGCGVCVDDFSMIPDAVRKVDANYQYFSDNCRKEYDNVYWFENYRKGLADFIAR